MNTRKILFISSNIELIDILKISALTLTKLNCQVSIDCSTEFDKIIKESKTDNLDLIIIDFDEKDLDVLKLILEIRNSRDSKSKKIISVYSETINKEQVYKAGCDSIMSKDEFKKVVNNLLQF